jgi:hypothetical protein
VLDENGKVTTAAETPAAAVAETPA